MRTSTRATRKPLGPRGVAIAALIGTTIEFYDFNVYTTSVVIVLGSLFFPSHDPLVSSLVALSTVGVGYFARPIGGVVFAHFGDRFSRKNTLIVSVVLMGLGTVLIGVLPTYEQVGVAAPVLLVTLRFVQGLAVGGEWGGAVLLAVEHAPRKRRGFYGSFPMFGSPLGILGSAGIIALFQLMPEEAFRSWGWRMPFLVSVVLLGLGIYMRLRIEESTQFVAAKRVHATVRVPLVQVLRKFWPSVLIGTGVCFIGHAGYIIASFLPSFVLAEHGFPKNSATAALMIGSVGTIIAMYLAAQRLDGRDLTKFTLFGGATVALWSFPAFVTAFNWGTFGLVLAITVNGSLTAVQIAAMPAVISRLFPANIRYTGISATYQLSAMLGGGLLPILTSYLVAAAGGAFWPAAALMSGAGSITVIASLLCHRLPVAQDEPGEDEETSAGRLTRGPTDASSRDPGS